MRIRHPKTKSVARATTRPVCPNCGEALIGEVTGNRVRCSGCNRFWNLTEDNTAIVSTTLTVHDDRHKQTDEIIVPED